MLESSWVAARLAASQAGLSSVSKSLTEGSIYGRENATRVVTRVSENLPQSNEHLSISVAFIIFFHWL
jgi:hypothetical protein